MKLFKMQLLLTVVVCWASSGNAAILWDYDSPLTVIEDVADIGGVCL